MLLPDFTTNGSFLCTHQYRAPKSQQGMIWGLKLNLFCCKNTFKYLMIQVKLCFAFILLYLGFDLSYIVELRAPRWSKLGCFNRSSTETEK